MSTERYVAIPPGAVIPGALPDFRIFVRNPQGSYTLWALEGNKVTSEQLARLAEGGHAAIFVDLEEQFKYEQYLEDNLGSILENKAASDDQKAEIFSKVSTNVVKGAFETSLGLGTMDRGALQRTQKLIENALLFIQEAKSLQALAKLIGHDYQTYEHATKVLWFTVSFLRLNQEILEQIAPGYADFAEERKVELFRHCAVGALLHDIGKSLVPRDILDKADPLTEVEWEIMKRHPLSGLAMLIDTDIPDFVRKAVLQHHEDYYGTGYPLGLEGPAINALARVIRIIDVFDAMTSRRPYKDPLPPLKAAQIMIGTPEEEGGKDAPIHQDGRDQGMRRCFDRELLMKFIVFLGDVKLGA
ncbi:MAG: HD-GYP domain-containing protein [Syntrophales bacterium]